MQYMGQGLPIAIIGYVMVFVVLCFLWGMLELMHVVIKATEKKPTQKQPVANSKPTVEIKEEVDDNELVAVITGAIAASLNTSTYNLKIKSIKHTETKNSVWSNASRNDAINNF